MLKRISLITLTILGLLLSASSPVLTSYAADNPGACAKLSAATPAATTAATKVATAAATSAATPAETKEAAKSGGTASISMNGGFAVYVLAQKWGEEYNKLHPEVQFDIQAAGAGKGMTEVLAGTIDIGLLSREVAKAEADKGAVAFPAGIDAVVFTVNAQNPVLAQIQSKGLSCATLQKLFTSDSKLTWGQVVGTDDSSPVNVYTRADSSGAADQTARYLGGTSQADLRGTGVQGDPGVIEAVRKDPFGIGYNNLAFAYDPSTGNVVDGAAVVPLDQNGNSKIDQEEAVYATHKDITAAIAASKYPWPPARQNYLVTKGAPQGAVLEFIKWTLTDGQAFVEDAGFVKTPDDKIKAALDSLK
jgi:phosphate transport system substrate-binding protein